MSRFNNGVHIPTILERTECPQHKVPLGIPCFHVDYDTVEGYGAGVCNNRVARAGYNGEITSFSLRQKNSGGRNDGRRNK